ncbi:hypothetical protein PIB30_090780 [Stylosanthes scabra]|uniref:Uncharacterized protein n=1 Tax=Stylosanthes scabra TaxID=79078 RepID=A0ABU6UT83_9FABA|nr:hypothetical protein [Stylosanthes scabra]
MGDFYEKMDHMLGEVKEVMMNNKSGIMLSTLTKKDGNYMTGGQELAEQILKHLPKDQKRVVIEGIASQVLAHSDDAVRKIFGAEHAGRVHGFSSTVCPEGFGKSKLIFGPSNSGVSNSASQQLVKKLENQVEDLKQKLYGYEETKA